MLPHFADNFQIFMNFYRVSTQAQFYSLWFNAFQSQQFLSLYKNYHYNAKQSRIFILKIRLLMTVVEWEIRNKREGGGSETHS